MLANIVAGVNKSVELDPKAEYVLVVSSDIPGINAEMVDWLIETCMETKEDMYYGVIPREVMEARYPGSNRTYTKLKDIQLCGADMHIAHVTMATEPEHLEMWEELIGNRKSPLKQAATIGFGTLLKGSHAQHHTGRSGCYRYQTDRHHRPPHHLGTRRTRHGRGQAASA